MQFIILILLSLTNAINCASFDWREKGAILPVPDQGECGHSSIINALDAISAVKQINGGKLIQLSRQQIYDCSTDWCPCGKAGNVSDVYEIIWKIGHKDLVDSESSYPYTGKCTHFCQFKEGAIALNGYSENTRFNGEKMFMELLKTGPVTVDINSRLDSFKNYKSGVYDDPKCDDYGVDHTLLLVGYGTDNGKDYWLARNSFGTKWGENGYIRIIRDKNMCGIGNAYVQPDEVHFLYSMKTKRHQ